MRTRVYSGASKEGLLALDRNPIGLPYGPVCRSYSHADSRVVNGVIYSLAHGVTIGVTICEHQPVLMLNDSKPSFTADPHSKTKVFVVLSTKDKQDDVVILVTYYTPLRLCCTWDSVQVVSVPNRAELPFFAVRPVRCVDPKERLFVLCVLSHINPCSRRT